jgi:hypothetical protein
MVARSKKDSNIHRDFLKEHMTTIIAEQSALNSIRTVVASVLSADVWTGRKRGRPSKFQQDLEFLRQDLAEKGDRLLAALQSEHASGSPNISQKAEDAVREWKECRTAVDRLSGDYAQSLARWREAVTAASDAEKQSPFRAARPMPGMLHNSKC